jgi:hypothetical protein
MSSIRTRFPLRGVVLALVIVSPVLADAPSDQYDFFSAETVKIKDRKTSLEWDRFVSGPVRFDDASCGPGTRLPTMKELLTLVDEEPHYKYDEVQLKNVPKMIDQFAFGAQTPIDKAYWTSSLDPGGQVWTVDFQTGDTRLVDRDVERYVRCVAFKPPRP